MRDWDFSPLFGAWEVLPSMWLSLPQQLTNFPSVGAMPVEVQGVWQLTFKGEAGGALMGAGAPSLALASGLPVVGSL